MAEMSNKIRSMIKEQKDAASTKHHLSKQWRDIRNKIDSLLISNNAIKSQDLRDKCAVLDKMTHDERLEYIATNWGRVFIDKVTPYLQQLNSIESQITALEKV